MRFLLLFSLLVILFHINGSEACKAMFSKKRMICYFASWADSRPSPANIQPEDFDPCLCTHVLYSFVDLRNSRLELKATDKDLFSRMASWKLKNPLLKISISIGGWTEQSTHFTPMVATQENRNLFCQSVIDTCRTYGLDGIDIDWEYPSVSQKQQYTDTMQTCFDLFTKEAQVSGKKRLLLTAATAPDGRMDALDIPVLNRILDFINPMTYDIHGSWDGNSAHHSPLYGWDGADSTLQRYIYAGMSPEKLNLGLAAYGRATASPGPYTREGGILSYYEICPLLCQSWTVIYDTNIQAPKAQNTAGYGHVFYDNQRSMIEKAKYVMNNAIGGAFIWDTSLDDFNGEFCCQGKFPLITAVINTFINITTNIALDCCSTTTTSSTSTTTITTATTESNTTPSSSSSTSSTTEFSSSTINSSINSTMSQQYQIIPSGTEFYGLCSNPSAKFYPHPTECNKFIECKTDDIKLTITESVLTCPANLKFNPEFGVCDWPENVVCTLFTPTIGTTSTVSSFTTATTISYLVVQSGTEFYGYCSDPNVEFYPHPSDCTKFIECRKDDNKGTITESVGKCPANLKYNVQLKICDWPENVICFTVSTTTTTTVLSTTISSTTPSTTTHAKEWLIVPSDPTEFYSLCKPEVQFLPHPFECSKFIKCTKDELKFTILEAVLSCPSTLLYDETLKMCNYASQVECIKQDLTTTTSTSNTPGSLCQPGDKILPHPTDCNRFIKCSINETTGELKDTIITCPEPFLFDKTINNCNWPSKVTC